MTKSWDEIISLWSLNNEFTLEFPGSNQRTNVYGASAVAAAAAEAFRFVGPAAAAAVARACNRVRGGLLGTTGNNDQVTL